MKKQARRTLLILGTKNDPHVRRVAEEIENRGQTKVLVADYLAGTDVNIRVTQNGQTEVLVDNTIVPCNCLVWDRTKILPGTELYVRGTDETSIGYIAQEWRALFTLLSGLHSDRVVNSLFSKRCMIKPYQQVVAATVGLKVPETLITTQRSAALRFHQASQSGLIMKSLSAGKVKPASDGGESIPYNLMTMRVHEQDLQAATDREVQCCPHFFQHEIPKSYELRVVVVGAQVLPFRVESQTSILTEVDWRKGIQLINFIPTDISEDLRSKILGFMSRIGFFTGSLDIVVDRQGQHWFLECNQDGAWGWLDDVVGGKVTRAFADEFEKKLDAIVPESISA